MNKHIYQVITILFILVLAANGAACSQAPALTPELTPVTVQLSWTHQAQFAGFYAADKNGYYAAEGLAVAFVEGGPAIDATTPVVDKTAQFGVTSADLVLLKRAQGDPVKVIATIYQRSPRVYMTIADSGITRPQDFIGKTIAVGRNVQPLLDAMMLRLGIQPDQYAVVDSTPGMEQLYSGQVQVRSVFLTNEVIAAQAAGYKFNLILPDDYGIHFYNQAIFTSDDLIASQPDLITRFLRASLKGWRYVIENPDQGGALVTQYNPQADLDLEVEKMSASLPLINTGRDEIGWMRPEIWAGMDQTLRSQGVLTQSLAVGDVYTLQFLKEVDQ